MEAETASVSAEQALFLSAGRKRRKLYRQATGSEVPWFPHDNDSELFKELCHEAGRPAGCTNNGKLRRILTLVLS